MKILPLKPAFAGSEAIFGTKPVKPQELDEAPSKMKNTSLVNVVSQICLMLTVFCAVAETPSRNTMPLSDWRFRLAEGTNTWAAPGQNDSTWDPVTLPHTWNNFDGQDGGGDYHRGTGWYRTSFQLPAAAGEQRVWVEFDAASKVADVFVNGKSVGTHTGAFARFRFDIPARISEDGKCEYSDVDGWHRCWW